MTILWLSHFVPYPAKGGCFQRSYNLLARVGAKHEVHMLALRHKRDVHPPAETASTRDALLRHCRSLEIVDISHEHHRTWMVVRGFAAILSAQPFSVAVYRSREARRRIRSLRDAIAFDVVHFDTIGLAQFADEVAGVPAVMTHHGAESQMIRRRIANEPSLLRKAFYVYEWLALRAYEGRMCPRFAANVVVSGDDGKLLAAIAPGSGFTTVENGVDVDYFALSGAPAGRRVVFAGRLDQYSNRHGMVRFMTMAWPLIQARYPDASIDIIGSNPPDEIRRLADRRVRVHGFVSDVRPYFSAATVAVCPLWDGGGTRLKVLDALAQGTPLVATSIACEGLAVEHERDVLIGNSPEELARQIGRLFDDVDGLLRQRLTLNGRGLVERDYSWDCIAPKLTALYEASARSSSGR